MNQVMNDIWPILLGAIVSAIGLYVGIINKMRSQISILEEKVKRLEQRQDNHSKKNDEIVNLISAFKLEMVEKIGQVSVQMGKIQSDVENINDTIAIFDGGIVSKKKNKKG